MLLQDGLAKYGQSLQNLLVLLLTFAFVLTDFSAFGCLVCVAACGSWVTVQQHTGVRVVAV